MMEVDGLSEYDRGQIVLVEQDLLPGSLVVSSDSNADLELLQKGLDSKGILSTSQIYDGFNSRLYISKLQQHINAVEVLSKNIDFVVYTDQEANIRHYMGDSACCIAERKSDMFKRKVRHNFTRFAIQTMRDYAGVADGLSSLHETGSTSYRGDVLKTSDKGKIYFEKFFGLPESENLREGIQKVEDTPYPQILIIGLSDSGYIPCKIFDGVELVHKDRFDLSLKMIGVLKKEGISVKKMFRRTSDILDRFQQVYFKGDVRHSSAREMGELRRIASSIGINFDFSLSDLQRNIFYMKRQEEEILKML